MRAGRIQDAFRALPFRPLDQIVPRTALILAPHADDESLGCGGLIASCCAAGRPPLVVIVTDGAASHPHSRAWPAARLRARRQAEARNAASILGLAPGRIVFLDLPDAAAPHEGPEFDRAVATLAELAARHACGTVLAPWRHDPHCDHEAVWKMGVALRDMHDLPLLAYPVWGWLIAPETELEQGPPRGMRLDITRYRSVKAEAIRAHESQYGDLIRDDPTGFRLPENLLSVFDVSFEVFLDDE
ncbi:PIG-L deacetylase family protein [Gluconacetobacter tumulisoli]|uniref:PIG-L family deacetylase n=1 Tax=Gluconacetobacter tumulisoli TaxID=1286189 RepID=A0A7W4PMW0_9PROT|nr:PIG-L deacetylase family protein [Gluconacetobacter tumulisoli]MBB2202044.1 PIG-L family deacetylase [Gluconacetobacter tumulisoli]